MEDELFNLRVAAIANLVVTFINLVVLSAVLALLLK